MLEIIHISDTHFGPDRHLDIRGANAYDRARALVNEVNALPFQPDLIVHTGDVANDPDEGAYALAAELLAELKAPVYYATGNHDDVAMMRHYLTFGDIEPLVDDSLHQLCYRVGGEVGEIADLYVLDGWVPPQDGPHGHISEAQIEAVVASISGEKPVAVFLHYPLVPVGSKWIDEHLLTDNGLEVQDRLQAAAGEMLRGVFTGHLHRGLKLYHSGVFHSGVSSPACEFTAGPTDDFCDFLPGGPIPFDHISIDSSGTRVKSYSMPFMSGE